MSLFAPVPAPASKLARYRVLSPLAGVHVSPLTLGGMSIGDQWNAAGMGAMDKTSSFELLDAFYEAGGKSLFIAHRLYHGLKITTLGNFIDTASN